ncbi:gamma-glutamyl-gamma-aminobutyrate hydrolase family protein [Rouxiella sp. T17]|uniref:glutamine amidotransferase-related protein n=1 Tax=Rouxiella sp. T17 TaxID=3085684 RepID=UPI002FC899C8
MTLTFVSHDTPEPALYGAMAAILAGQQGKPLAHLAVDWNKAAYADACQHVTANGHLVTSGLLWHERLNGKSAENFWPLESLINSSSSQDLIVPLAPSQQVTFNRFAQLARDFSIDYQVIEISESAKGFHFNSAKEGEISKIWRRDRYGRFITHQRLVNSTSAHRLRIALVGSYQDQKGSYPATLAALGDAIDAMALNVEVIFLPPQSSAQTLANTLASVDGVVLPGGSDMRNVAGQIRVAHYCLNHKKPILGLCLGMQTMATAAIQQMLGNTQANLAEADPQAAFKTFVPLAAMPGNPVHRLGDDNMFLAAGTHLAAVLGNNTQLRYNHRFHLNPLFKDDLARSGLIISGTDRSGTIADGIEHAAHPFYLGVQGHPELTSSVEQPHPLISAFLRAAADLQ